MSFKWRNQDDFLRSLGDAQASFEDAVRKAVTHTTAEVMGQSMLLAPVDEGTLRASGSFYIDGSFVEKTPPKPPGATDKVKPNPNLTGGREVKRKSGRIRGVFGFNTPYAAYQHETTGLRHPKGGKSKYAERAMRKIKPKVRGVVRKIMSESGF